MAEVKEYKNIREIIYESAENFKEKIAFVIKHKANEYENITYKKFLEDINKLGTSLFKMGFENKRIAVIGRNRYEWVLTFTAIVSGVGIAVPLDKGLPDEEIEMSLKKSKAEVIFCEETYLDTIKNIVIKGETAINKIICMDKADKIENIRDLIRKR